MSGAIHKDAQLKHTTALSTAWIFASPVGPRIPLAPEMGGDGGIPETSISTNDAAEELLRRWSVDAEKPSASAEEDDNDGTDETEESDDDSEQEAPEDGEETEESDDEADEDADKDNDESEDEEDDEKPKILKDKDIVKVTVDGKEIDVPVEKLKRLYGQEAALTRKSQETAALRKKAEESGARAVAASEKLLARAIERYKPYANIDWLVAAKTLDTEELSALRGEAEKAYADVNFISQEVDAFMGEVTKQRKTEQLEEARNTFKSLTDPKTGIRGFNEQMYNEMRVYAINSGVPEAVVNEIVSEPIIRMLHKAFLHDKGQKALTKTKSTIKKGGKIIKGKANADTTRTITKVAPHRKAATNLKVNGRVEDAAELLLQRWKDED